MIQLDHPIKMLGLHPVRVALHAEVGVNVTVNVARSAEEAQLQIEHGGAIIGAGEPAAEGEAAAAEGEAQHQQEDAPAA